MGCASCSGTNGVSKGCGNKGHCESGSCNKLNTFDWLAKREIPISAGQNIVEVSFKNGAHKGFFFMESNIQVSSGEMVVVNSGNGYDVGRLSLTGDLVTLQMKKKKVTHDRVLHNVIRKANERDLEKLQEARDMDIPAMIKARVIARSLNIDMKLGDVEFQGDKRKVTFYYTAEGRVDFRELVREYAKEFKVKVEMRQIGSRQESARIGGIGSCGRELCCSTWLTDFKSVSTTAARYQYMAINQSKLSGQCGRLKCCLNYELDNYMDALKGFPEKADYLKTKNGSAKLMKIDIFKGIMYYSIQSEKGRSTVVVMDKDDVKLVIEKNKKGDFPESLAELQQMAVVEEIDDFLDYEDTTGAVELPMKKKKTKPSKNRNKARTDSATDSENKANNPAGPRPNRSNKPNSNNPNQQKPKPNKPADNVHSGSENVNTPNPSKSRNSRNKKKRPNQNGPKPNNPNAQSSNPQAKPSQNKPQQAKSNEAAPPTRTLDGAKPKSRPIKKRRPNRPNKNGNDTPNSNNPT